MEVATAVAAALNFFPRGQRLQHSRGDLEMALTTDTVAHNSHGFFASHAEALEILQDMDGDFCSRGFDLGHAPNGVCVGLQFELLQLEQSFDNFRHWNSFLQELCREPNDKWQVVCAQWLWNNRGDAMAPQDLERLTFVHSL